MVNFLLSTVKLGVTEDALSMEITIMVICSVISWIIGLIVSFVIKENKIIATIVLIFLTSAVLNYFGVLLYDIFYNNAFGDIFRIIQFIIAAVLTIFTALLWTLVSTIVGTILVLLLNFSIGTIYNFIKIHLKEKRILNSEIFKEILKLINDINEEQIHYMTISDIDIEIVSENSKTISYEEKGYSNLDNVGKKSLGVLLRKKLKNFKMITENDLIILRNEDYERDKKSAEKKQRKAEKEEIKRKKREKKEKVKSGKDW